MRRLFRSERVLKERIKTLSWQFKPWRAVLKKGIHTFNNHDLRVTGAMLGGGGGGGTISCSRVKFIHSCREKRWGGGISPLVSHPSSVAPGVIRAMRVQFHGGFPSFSSRA